jgi:hypothetical protein
MHDRSLFGMRNVRKGCGGCLVCEGVAFVLGEGRWYTIPVEYQL